MKKNENKETTCRTCGRIITNPKNKSGLCNSCKQKSFTIASVVLGAGMAAKKFGPTLVKGCKILFLKLKRK